MTTTDDHDRAPSAPVQGPAWPARVKAWLGGATIQGRLVRNFAIAILVPAVVTSVVGVGMIRQHVFAQAQTQVNADLEAAKEIYQTSVDRLQDAIRIHATRMVIYGALTRRDTTGLAEEMDRIRRAEHLDVLTLTDADGRVFYRSGNPAAPAGGDADDGLVSLALKSLEPAAGTEVVEAGVLARESPALARQAAMTISPTPRARPTATRELRSGMMLRAAAPVSTPAGRLLGVLDGGVLLTRNYEIVDKIRRTVFKEEEYKGRPVGTATIFQNDVRISTNVRSADGTRAIGTQASAEVADAVLTAGRDLEGPGLRRAGLVPVGLRPDPRLLRRDRRHALRRRARAAVHRQLVEQPAGVPGHRRGRRGAGVPGVGAGRPADLRRPSTAWPSPPSASRRATTPRRSTAGSDDELGYLAHSFNTMTAELQLAHTGAARERRRTRAEGRGSARPS